MRQRKSTKLLEKPVLVQLLAEPDQSSMLWIAAARPIFDAYPPFFGF